jgi:formyltetrahydrofolate deformylase
MSDPQDYVLRIRCRDTVGIVAAVISLIATHGANVQELQETTQSDGADHVFFMRVVLRSAAGWPADEAEFAGAFAPMAKRFAMEWDLSPAARRMRVLIAVSRFDHCLNALLNQWRSGYWKAEPVGIVSNHPDLEPLARWHGIPYHHLPLPTPADKPRQEAQMMQVFRDTGAELFVLARYMQVLSDDMSRALQGRCINIHHSFLPSFKGGRPYHQAWARGVKLVGATAHYVTADLDEGPIIEQDVVRVDHTLSADDLAVVGREVESRVLAQALRWHVNRRVMLNGTKTVVFRGGL